VPNLPLALALWALTFGAQSRAPAFEGKWVLDWTLTDAANAELGGPGEPHGAAITLTVTQNAKVVTVQQGSHPARRYNLDGSDSLNTVVGVNGQMTRLSTATIDRGHLRIVTRGPRGDATSVWTVERGNLKIVTTSPSPDGSGMSKTALVFRPRSSNVE
jgi:hypothetical protein